MRLCLGPDCGPASEDEVEMKVGSPGPAESYCQE